MAMPATHMEWTVDMLDALPDDGQRYEIIDGALFVTPASSDVHQYVVGELYARLLGYLLKSSRPAIRRTTTRRSACSTWTRAFPNTGSWILTHGRSRAGAARKNRVRS
ncbi:MAG TPA: hypothetical protein VKP00_05665 [Gemmatimonadaceae bacterium]|nr:hypothetical protein [Gemmatimonadaceae bacterium]